MREIIYELNNYMLTNSYICKSLIKKQHDIFSNNKTKKINKNNEYCKIKFNNSGVSTIYETNNENNNDDHDNDNDNNDNNNDSNNNDSINSVNLSKNEEYFEPDFKDKLFWCFYIILNGQSKYELVKISSFKEEKDFKIKSIEQLNKIKEQIKLHKLKLNEIKNELINETKISIKSLYALCILYKINIMYININKGIYYNCFGDNNIEETKICEDNNDNLNIKFFNLPYIIIENVNKIFILNNSNEKFNYYKNKYYCIENISKPVKSISNYTITEIQDLCNKLNIPIKTADNKKINKQELYNAIVNKLE